VDKLFFTANLAYIVNKNRLANSSPAKQRNPVGQKFLQEQRCGTPLMFAAQLNSTTELIKALFKNGADFNAVAKDRSPLIQGKISIGCRRHA